MTKLMMPLAVLMAVMLIAVGILPLGLPQNDLQNDAAKLSNGTVITIDSSYARYAGNNPSDTDSVPVALWVCPEGKE